MKKLELLAPAGSLEICKAVIQAGADAVYLGGSMFGARAYAQNFNEAQLKEALDYAHTYERKIFLTVNTLLKNRELEEQLYEYMEPLYRYGLDAAIVQDFGVLEFLHRNFPDLPLHASTQMSVTGRYGGDFLKSCGVTRIVTAREVSLDEIEKLYRETGMEIESFVHGALCYCYSGLCLMSSVLGGRSGNRGRCAQPCRLGYQVMDQNDRICNPKEPHPLSPKDLCAVRLIPDMARAGVYSFKIEGRMKQLEYAAGVTGIYRKYMDLYEQEPRSFDVSREDYRRLLDLGNRSGFTEGYYKERNSRGMMAFENSSHKSVPQKEQPKEPARKILLEGKGEFLTGKPCSLTLRDGKHQVCVEGEIVQKAKKQPLGKEELEKRLKKTGDTPYELEKLEITADPDGFLPVGQINGLRRAALEKFQEEVLAAYRRPASDRREEALNVCGKKIQEKQKQPKLSVLARSMDQLTAALECPRAESIYIDSSLLEETGYDISAVGQRIRQTGKKAFLCFPGVFRDNTAKRYEEIFDSIRESVDGVLARTYDSLGFALSKRPDSSFAVIADHSLYTFSDRAFRGFSDRGVQLVTAPFELNEGELRHRDNGGTEMIVYGWIPMMITAQCIYKNFDSCYRKDPMNGKRLYLQDRFLKKFLITRNCKDCYNMIYNSQPLYLMHQALKLKDMGFASFRIEFLTETKEEAKGVLDTWAGAFLENRRPDLSALENQYTNGHFRRGIE